MCLSPAALLFLSAVVAVLRSVVAYPNVSTFSTRMPVCIVIRMVVSFTNNCRFTLSLSVFPLLRCCGHMQFVAVWRSVVVYSRVSTFLTRTPVCIIILLCRAV